MTWSVATPTCVAPSSSMPITDASTPRTAPTSMPDGVARRRHGEVVAEELVGAVDEVDVHGGRPASRPACYNEATTWLRFASRALAPRPRRRPRFVARRPRRPHPDGVRRPIRRRTSRGSSCWRKAVAKGARHRLHAGAVPVAVLLPDRGPSLLRAGRDDSRAVHRRLPGVAKKHGVGRGGVAVREARRRAVPQHRRGHRRRRVAAWASTARCTSPTTRSSTRSSTSRPATPASARGRRRQGTIGVLICWDQWYPRGRAADRAAGRRDPVLPHRHRLASDARRREYGAAQHDAWELIQRSHAVANGCYVCAPNRVGHERVAGRRRASPVNKDGIAVLGTVVRRRARRVRS